MRMVLLLRTLTVLFVSIIVTACASGPTPQELANADYGRFTTQEECRTRTEFALRFISGTTAPINFDHESCVKGYWTTFPILSMEERYGWLLSGEMEYLNAQGDARAYMEYRALIRDGLLLRVCVLTDRRCNPGLDSVMLERRFEGND